MLCASQRIPLAWLSLTPRQVSAIRRGLVEVIPERALKLCTWEELEVLVCGDPRIDVAVMKANTTYHGYSVRAQRANCLSRAILTVVWPWL